MRPSKRTLILMSTAVTLATQILALPHARQLRTTISQDGAPIPPSGLIGYLASPRGRTLRQSSEHPMLRALGQKLGETKFVRHESPADASQAGTLAQSAAAPTAVVSGCGATVGTRFNLEPRAAPAVAPQYGPSVDFLPGGGSNGTDLVIGSA